MAEDAFKPVLKRKANKFTINTRFDHELHSAMSYEPTNRFKAITEGNVEFESWSRMWWTVARTVQKNIFRERQHVSV